MTSKNKIGLTTSNIVNNNDFQKEIKELKNELQEKEKIIENIQFI